jgi:hypothetical protein
VAAKTVIQAFRIPTAQPKVPKPRLLKSSVFGYGNPIGAYEKGGDYGPVHPSTASTLPIKVYARIG